jgi:hypothetical protein
MSIYCIIVEEKGFLFQRSSAQCLLQPSYFVALCYSQELAILRRLFCNTVLLIGLARLYDNSRSYSKPIKDLSNAL